jgi:hypothetical protein
MQLRQQQMQLRQQQMQLQCGALHLFLKLLPLPLPPIQPSLHLP